MSKPTSKPRGRPQQHKLKQTEMAALAHVSVKTLLQWRKLEGIDITDKAQVMARAAVAKRKEPITASAAGESYSEAKRRRAIADADRAEIIALRESGSVIAVADVEALLGQLGAEMRSRLLAMRGDLVVELEGRTSAQIYTILDNRICELLKSIHESSLTP